MTFVPHYLTRFSIQELAAIYDAASAAVFAWQAVENMPRCSDIAAHFIEDRIGETGVIVDSAIAEIQTRAPASVDELELQTLYLLKSGLDQEAPIAKVAAILSQHKRKAAKLRRRKAVRA